ncbi:MAG: hypothetical protein U1E39_10345 [Planctomycetota bacterium]
MSPPRRSPALRYRRVAIRTWSDPWFRQLGPMQPSGRALWLCLATGPTTTSVPGLSLCGIGALADVVEWPSDVTDRILRELEAAGAALVDRNARIVFLPHALEANRPESLNVVKAWAAALTEVPESAVRDEVVARVRSIVAELGPEWVDAFEGNAPPGSGPRGDGGGPPTPGEPASRAPAKPSRKASDKASPKASDKPSASHPASLPLGNAEGFGFASDKAKASHPVSGAGAGAGAVVVVHAPGGGGAPAGSPGTTTTTAPPSLPQSPDPDGADPVETLAAALHAKAGRTRAACDTAAAELLAAVGGDLGWCVAHVLRFPPALEADVFEWKRAALAAWRAETTDAASNAGTPQEPRRASAKDRETIGRHLDQAAGNLKTGRVVTARVWLSEAEKLASTTDADLDEIGRARGIDVEDLQRRCGA